ncbi:RNA pseudouridine synthase 6- chloroplastic [Striga hermonthica]|uniref:RNA pseudouridine synthase 6- chloroplastic n=1 Tax=Striga hermonthica TaxID=68872 RepID=A0A9N7RDZ7_STRHE|nr:RNA pseudouridine synthase 6- chloroplastic [Striga hermonthica]
MAIGATTTAFTSISASTTLSSLVLSSIFRRSFSAPINLKYPLVAKRSLFRSIRKYHAVNAVNKNLSFESPSSPDVILKSSSPNSDNCYPPYVRLLPCPSQNGPPRVEHLVVSEGGPALGYISKALDLPPLFVADLIRFGAVFYALVCPDPPATATPEQIKMFKKYTDPLFLRQRSSIKGKTKREAQKTFRITHADEFVETGTYLRVHVHPKRFPRCYEIDWKSRIIAVTENYVVLDKPAGTSIRAQLAACGAPLVGDSMYMPAAIAEANCPGLNPFGKHNQNKYDEDDEAKSLAVEEWIACHGKEPTVAIGLQACYISWDDNGPHTYEAGSPWWR